MQEQNKKPSTMQPDMSIGTADFDADIAPYLDPLAQLGYDQSRTKAFGTNVNARGVFFPKQDADVIAKSKGLGAQLFRMAAEGRPEFAEGDLVYKNTAVDDTPSKQKTTYAHEYRHRGFDQLRQSKNPDAMKVSNMMTRESEEDIVRRLDNRHTLTNKLDVQLHGQPGQNPLRRKTYHSFSKLAKRLDNASLSELARQNPNIVPEQEVKGAFAQIVSKFFGGG
tara:strand:+ start:584 stop:1252 length:669 start_codon:yes stop_codon:yes gene_type:complete